MHDEAFETITFEYSNTDDNYVRRTVEDGNLTEVIHEFVQFLRQAGFFYVGMKLDDANNIVITKDYPFEDEEHVLTSGFAPVEWVEAMPEEVVEAEHELYEAEEDSNLIFKIGDKVLADPYGDDEVLIGRVVGFTEYGVAEVEFPGWDRGHEGNSEDETIRNRWFLAKEDLTPVSSDYWDEAVGRANDELIHVGDRVRHLGTGKPDGMVGYGGFTRVSLVGHTGTVIETREQDGERGYLVKWDNWTDGHDGHGLGEPRSNNHWWVFEDNIDKLS